jgi:regulator of protease activity HflC (stomatin/prohibitin superfamily)
MPTPYTIPQKIRVSQERAYKEAQRITQEAQQTWEMACRAWREAPKASQAFFAQTKEMALEAYNQAREYQERCGRMAWGQ